MKRFAHIREDWKLVVLALFFVVIIMLCYGWGIAKVVSSFENALGIQPKANPPESFHIEEAKKILQERQ